MFQMFQKDNFNTRLGKVKVQYGASIQKIKVAGNNNIFF